MVDENARKGRLNTCANILFIGVFLLAACGKTEAASPQPAGKVLQAASTALPEQPAGTAQTKPGAAPRFGAAITFKHLSVERGLSASVVYTIFEDSLGFIWIGTWDGLNRYDGYNFKVYKHDPQDPGSLSSNTVWAIYEDKQGTLWLGTDNGLNKFDRSIEKFTSYKNNPADSTSLGYNRVGSILEDAQGMLWIGTLGGGLDLFDRSSQHFTHYRSDQADADSLSDNIIGTLYQDASGKLWVGTWNGLDLFDRTIGHFRHYRHDPLDPGSLANNQVRAITADKSGSLWVGTIGGGLDKLDTISGRFLHYQQDPQNPDSLNNNTVWSVYMDASGVLWVGTNEGLNQYRAETDSFIRYHYDAESPEDTESLSSPIVYTIFQNRSGVYWLGTSGGGLNLFDYSTERFTHYRHDSQNPGSLSNNMVWAIFRDREGVLWVGTAVGLNRYDQDTGQFVHYFHQPDDPYSLSSDTIAAIFQDRKGDLWISTSLGLNQYDRAKDRFIHYQPKVDEGSGIAIDLSEVPILAANEDLKGAIWFGTRGAGLLKLNPTTMQVTTSIGDATNSGDTTSTVVTSMLVDKTGVLWFGTPYGGLNRFDSATGQLTHFMNDPDSSFSLSDNTVNCIIQDHASTLWIGTLGGLNKFDPATQTFTHYRQKDGLPSDVIYGIIEDNQNYLWMSTNNGITRFDPVSSIFKNFDREDGLQSNEFNNWAYFQDASGYIYFGGINGLNQFDPGQIQGNTYIPPIVLTSLTQGGEKVISAAASEQLDMVNFKWPKNYFEFEFAALSYTQPDKNQYAYKLVNFDQEWNTTGTRRFGKYTNLPGGSYTLLIKGSNNDGVWNEKGIALRINVIPPFWETTWFLFTAVGVGLAGLFAGYRLRLHSIQQNNRQLTRQVSERTREIEQRRQVAEGLREIMLLLNSNQSLEESLDYIARQVGFLVKAELVFIIQIIGGSGKLLAACMADRAAENNPLKGILDQCVPGAAARLPQDVLDWAAGRQGVASASVFRAGQAEIQSLPAQLSEVCTAVVAPILPEKEYFGALVVLFVEDKSIRAEELEMLASFADQAALAVGNARLRSRAEEMAVISERTRLARDLHDAVTQTLFSASLIAEALPALYDHDRQEGRQLLGELRQLNRGAMSEMRALLMELRPAALLDAKLPNLLSQLGEVLSGRTHIQVDLDFSGDFRLPTEVHVGFYRIAQEAINNILKHSGASRVTLRLVSEILPDHVDQKDAALNVIMEICDNGCGFDISQVKSGHFGLVNIHERAQAIGACLKVDSQPGEGTQVKVEWQGKG